MQVLTPMQVAVLAVETWPVVPDLISLGSTAESELQGGGSRVGGRPASQQPGQPAQGLAGCSPTAGALTIPSSRLHGTPDKWGLSAHTLQESPSPQPLSAGPSSPCTAAPDAHPAGQSGNPSMGPQQPQMDSPASMRLPSQAILPKGGDFTAARASQSQHAAAPGGWKARHPGLLPAGDLQQVWGMQDAQSALTDPWHDRPHPTPVSTALSLSAASNIHVPIAGSGMERALSRDPMNVAEPWLFQHPSIASPSLAQPPAIHVHPGHTSASHGANPPGFHSSLLGCAGPSLAASRDSLAANIQDGAGSPTTYGPHGIPAGLVHLSNTSSSHGAGPALQETPWIPELTCPSSPCCTSIFEEPLDHLEAL